MFFDLQTPKVTPIHEPQNEGYYALPSEVPLTYGSPELYQRAEYESAYKVPIANPTYVKYEATPKPLLTKHQSISNSNAYASLAPVYAYPNSDSGFASSSSAAGTAYPQTKKYTTYDPENNVQIQYVIKYVPVPYTVAATDQYPHNVPQSAYITPKPYLFKESVASAAAKKPTVTVAQSVQAVSPGSYASSTEGYAEYAKYAESYASAAASGSAAAAAAAAAAADEYSQQYPPQFKSYVHAPSYKYYDKNAYAKKYAPTSYVLAAVGKSASTHYASSIRHDSSASDHDHDGVYATKLAPVPLTVDKYTAQDNYKSAAADHDTDTKSYVDGDYSSPSLYSSLPDSGVKYKSSLVAAPVPVPHFFNYEHDSPFQYQSSYHKKDVSASISSTRTADSSTEKLR